MCCKSRQPSSVCCYKQHSTVFYCVSGLDLPSTHSSLSLVKDYCLLHTVLLWISAASSHTVSFLCFLWFCDFCCCETLCKLYKIKLFTTQASSRQKKTATRPFCQFPSKAACWCIMISNVYTSHVVGTVTYYRGFQGAMKHSSFFWICIPPCPCAIFSAWIPSSCPPMQEWAFCCLSCMP